MMQHAITIGDIVWTMVGFVGGLLCVALAWYACLVYVDVWCLRDFNRRLLSGYGPVFLCIVLVMVGVWWAV
jgi:hypothetical protein